MAVLASSANRDKGSPVNADVATLTTRVPCCPASIVIPVVDPILPLYLSSRQSWRTFSAPAVAFYFHLSICSSASYTPIL